MPLDQLDDLIETTLDDYLLALADGIQRAQQQLDQVAVGRPGQPTVAYHLPRVEFELKMTFAMRGASGDAGASGKPATALLMRPAAPTSQEDYSGEASSVIRGAFVAVPVTGARAPATLRCALARRGPRSIDLTVSVVDGRGEPLVDVPVQIDVDRERSAELSPASDRLLAAATDVAVGLLRTDAAGQAATTLTIDPAEPDDALVVLVLEAAGATETVLVRATP